MLTNSEVYKISVLCRRFEERAIEVIENPDLLDFYIQRHDTLYISSWFNLTFLDCKEFDRNAFWHSTFSFCFIHGKGRVNIDSKSNDKLRRFSFQFCGTCKEFFMLKFSSSRLMNHLSWTSWVCCASVGA